MSSKKNWQIDRHPQILLNNCCFKCLTDPSAMKQPSSSTANKEELPGIIISSKAEMVPDQNAWFESNSTLFFLLSFFFRFLLLFSINIYLNNSYLIKYNKEREKYRVSREKIAHRILNIWINILNFYHFLHFTVAKPESITTWSFSKQCSHEFFL